MNDKLLTTEEIKTLMAQLNEKEYNFPEKISHPSHYTRENAMECIDEMKLVFGQEAVMNFCLLNAWKYRYRAGEKDTEARVDDLKKSDWYINKYKELKEKNSTNTGVNVEYYPKTTITPLTITPSPTIASPTITYA